MIAPGSGTSTTGIRFRESLNTPELAALLAIITLAAAGQAGMAVSRPAPATLRRVPGVVRVIAGAKMLALA